MAIYIKGATMPTSCSSCPFENGGDCYGGKAKYIMDVDDDEELFRNSRHPNCPLVYMPEPHGSLIDADALEEYYCKYCVYDDAESCVMYPCYFIHNLQDAPTVIEGSE